VEVLVAMTVLTMALVCSKVGASRFKRSTAMRFKAVLSSTTTQSALSVKRLSDSMEL